MQRLAAFLLAYPRLVVLLILLPTLGFGAAAVNVRVDPSLEHLIFEGDPDMVFYRQFKERFGSDEFVVVGFTAPRLFDRPALEVVRRISDGLAAISLDPTAPGQPRTRLVDWVLSLTTTEKISAGVVDGESVLTVEPLVRALPDGPEERRWLWERVVRDPIFIGNVIAAPRHEDVDAPLTTLVFARIVTREGDLEYRKVVEERTRELLAREMRREVPVRTVLLRETVQPELVERVLTRLAAAVPSDGDAFSSRLDDALAEELPDPALAHRLADAVLAEAAELDGFHVAGTVLIKSTLGHLAELEFARLTPISWLVIFGVLLVVFRSASAVWIPLLVVVLAGIWAVGFLAVCGSLMNVISSVIVPLIEVIGIATTIHFFAHFYRLRDVRPEQRVRDTLETVGWPCFLASFTTAIGFLSLSVSRVQAVRELAYYSAFGVMAAWLIAVTLGPVLALRVAPRVAAVKSGPGGRVLGAALDGLAHLTDRHRWAVAVAGVLLMAAAVVGIQRIRAETYLLGFLDESHRLRRDYAHLEAEFGGISPLDFTVRTPPGELLEPAVLARIDGLQRWLEAQPEIDSTFSVVDYVKRVNQALHDDDPAFHRIPETRAAVATALLLLEGSAETGPFLYPGWEGAEEARVLARRIEDMSSSDFSALLERTRDYMAEHVASSPSLVARSAPSHERWTGIRLIDTALTDVRDALAALRGRPPPPPAPEPALASGQIATRATGITLLYVNTESTLVASQMSSLMVAFVMIWALVTVAFRSFTLGAIAMVPNLFPVLMVLGFMGYTGITINIGTVMIGAICIGIAVDDTLHFLTRYRRRLVELGDVRAAVHAAIREVGRPVVITSFVLSLGFLTLRFSSFTPHNDFGLLSALTIVMALVGDLLLLPACLLILKPGARRR